MNGNYKRYRIEKDILSWCVSIDCECKYRYVYKKEYWETRGRREQKEEKVEYSKDWGSIKTTNNIMPN
jgi:hypothetical protein